MAIQKIGFPNKVWGDRFTTAEVSEIKVVVNNNADELTAMNSRQDSLATRQTSVETRMSANESNTNQNAQNIATLNTLSNTLYNQMNTVTARGYVVNQTETTKNVSPNVLNRWATPVTGLTIGFANGEANHAWEYMLEFTVATSGLPDYGFRLSWRNAAVRWLEQPEWEPGYTYQVSILNGLAIGAGWEAATS